MPKIYFFTKVNPTRAYSGIKYLCDSLSSMGFEVILYAWIPIDNMSETTSWNFKVNTFSRRWYAKLPILRSVLCLVEVFFISLFNTGNIIYHELTFFRVLYYIKKLRPNKKLIHYATELYTVDDVPKHKNLLIFYKKHASIPDLVIECDSFRAKYRIYKYKLTTDIIVINNTIPLIEHKYRASLFDLAGIGKKINIPIVVYTGAGYLHREIDLLIDGIYKAKNKFFFIAFCYGPIEEINIIREYANNILGEGNCKICSSVERELLLSCIDQADIGIVYYKPSLSIGNSLASPTKFYEYISNGLPVLSSNNITLTTLIEKYNLGCFVKDESADAIGVALDEINEKLIQNKNWNHDIKSVFYNNLEYSINSKSALNKLAKVLS